MQHYQQSRRQGKVKGNYTRTSPHTYTYTYLGDQAKQIIWNFGKIEKEHPTSTNKINQHDTHQ